MKIDNETVLRALKVEKKNLRLLRKRDIEENRARFSAATEDAQSRVLMLEDLLEEEAPAS